MTLWATLLLRGDAVYVRDSLSRFRIHADQQQSDGAMVRRLRQPRARAAGRMASPRPAQARRSVHAADEALSRSMPMSTGTEQRVLSFQAHQPVTASPSAAPDVGTYNARARACVRLHRHAQQRSLRSSHRPQHGTGAFAHAAGAGCGRLVALIVVALAASGVLLVTAVARRADDAGRHGVPVAAVRRAERDRLRRRAAQGSDRVEGERARRVARRRRRIAREGRRGDRAPRQPRRRRAGGGRRGKRARRARRARTGAGRGARCVAAARAQSRPRRQGLRRAG